MEYLKTPLDEVALKKLMGMLDEPPGNLVRRDKHFKDLGLSPDDCAAANSVAGLLAAHPRLMQRPIAVRGGRAVIGRPPERVEILLQR